MVTSQFGSLLQELEDFFKCKLEPDENNSCLVKMQSGLRIQLELDRYGEHLMIGSRLGALPPGRYREEVFKQALKSNEFYPPLTGMFGFSKKSGQLILFTLIDLRGINQDKMLSILTPFIARAQKWADALNQGNIPLYNEEPTSPRPAGTGLFGLIH